MTEKDTTNIHKNKTPLLRLLTICIITSQSIGA